MDLLGDKGKTHKRVFGPPAGFTRSSFDNSTFASSPQNVKSQGVRFIGDRWERTIKKIPSTQWVVKRKIASPRMEDIGETLHFTFLAVRQLWI
jgi:hypothetical protein